MTSYVGLPVTREKIRGGFRYTDGERLSPEEESRLATLLDELARTANRAIWMNPETDRSVDRGARVFGRPLELDGRSVRYVPMQEGAIFPCEDRHSVQ